MSCLGVSCHFHNSAAAYAHRGRLVAAVEEERFSRQKLDAAFPRHSIEWCTARAIAHTGKPPSRVCFYEKPLLRTIRRSPVSTAGHLISNVASRYLSLLAALDEMLPGVELVFASHHLSHAASAFFVSPFVEATVLVMDGVGEYSTATIYLGKDGTLSPLQEVMYPNSAGLLYAMVTTHLGFRALRDEYKVMGLAAFGSPRFVPSLRQLCPVSDRGVVNLSAGFNASLGAEHIADELAHALGPRRRDTEPLCGHHADVAASIQLLLEESVSAMWAHACSVTGVDTLCVAGGVALNCRANTMAVQATGIREVFIQPAAGDAGAALGAALLGEADQYPLIRDRSAFDPYLGPAYDTAACVEALRDLPVSVVHLDDAQLCGAVVQRILDSQIVAWFQGRAEFGPRALGNRSILADPSIASVKTRLNALTKSREDFRPFAPAVAECHAADYFEIFHADPYMLFVGQVRPHKRDLLSAVVHHDGSSRLQLVSRSSNARLFELLMEMERRGRPPILLNTSFNHSSEPMVLSPADALRTFLSTDIDALALGNVLVAKAARL